MATSTTTPSTSSTDPPTTTMATFLSEYKSILAKHLSDPSRIRDALSATTDHPLWTELADFISRANATDLQALLDGVFAQQAIMYPLPATAARRPTAKRVDRLCHKMGPLAAHRSNFCDWMACRFTGTYGAGFEECKAALAQSLSPDTIVVWRYDYRASEHDDIMHQGYAYRPGALSVMEIQVLEPIAAWVFTSNSLHKHADQVGRVTFSESKELYNAIKTAILNNVRPTEEYVHNVVQYYETKRKEKGGDPALLDRAQLAELQRLIRDRFP